MQILKEIRQEAGYTIPQTAAMSGVSTGLISEIEQGKADNLKFSTIEKLATLFFSYRDDIHKAGKRIPRDIFFQIVESKKSFDEIRTILKNSKV